MSVESPELHAKLLKMSEMQTRLVNRYRELQLSAQPDDKSRIEEVSEQPIEINLLAEPASITEIEFSNEMKLKLCFANITHIQLNYSI